MVRRVGLCVAGAVMVTGIITLQFGSRRGSAASLQPDPSPSAAAAKELESAPRILAGADLGVGRWVQSVSGLDLSGKAHSFSQMAGPKGLVLALVSSSCPVSKKLAPALGRLEAEYAARGVRFAYLAATRSDTSPDLTAMAKAAGMSGPILRSPDGNLLARLDMTSTTEVFVIDAARTLVYRGAVSDQYGPTWSLDAPRTEYLRPALEALLADRAPDPAATTAPGCALKTPEILPSIGAPVNYHQTVSRIIQSHCGECHRKGGLAPFSLETMADVTSHAAMIERVVQAGRMPPWFAAPEPAGKPSKWANDRTLPSTDKAELLAWLKGFKPAGNPADAPRPRKYDPDWQTGKPDAVFQLPEPVSVKAEGTMPYVTREVETNFKEDRWIQAIEVAPTDRSVVHHVLVLLRSGAAGRGSEAGDELSGFFGIYVPGNSTLVYPPGFAKKLPAGSRLRFQMHYTPNGKATTDQTRVGFKFATKPPEHEVRVGSLANVRIAIPAGAANHPETARLPVPVEAKVLAFLPHMHLRGKAAKYEAVAPDGTRQTLLDVPKYDFNWQLYYRLVEPVTLKPGSRVEFTGHFDNSSGNPANPDPNKIVRWGPQTTDEMLLGYVEYYLTNPAAGALPSRGGGGESVEALFKRADKNSDGKVTPDELPRPILFKRLDVNGDGVITLEEAKARLPGAGR